MSEHADTHGDHDHDHGRHHIVPMSVLIAVLVALVVCTVITVAASYVHLGRTLNILVAMAIATFKGTLVVMYFMHLKYDKPFHTVVFVASLGFVALFLGMATLDTHQYEHRMIDRWAEPHMERLRNAEGITFGEHGEGGEVGAVSEETKKLQQMAVAFFREPLPKEAENPDNPVTDEKVALGQMLYHDTRLSATGEISCNSCHDLAGSGDDGRPVSPGINGQLGTRNSPTVFNAALQRSQFWDGRAADVEEQVGKQLLNPVEMGMPSEQAVVDALAAIPGYAEPFRKAFPDAAEPITFENVRLAIAAFERRLLTPGRFDAWLGGKLDALTKEEVAGFRVYMDVGCSQCHTSTLVGGDMLQKLGLREPYDTKDKGLAESSGRRSDEFMFKVSQLRNVTRTGPWLHDGSFTKLEDLIKTMAKYQLGRELTDDQTQALVTFLGSLEGELDPALKKTPELPK